MYGVVYGDVYHYRWEPFVNHSPSVCQYLRQPLTRSSKMMVKALTYMAYLQYVSVGVLMLSFGLLYLIEWLLGL